MATPARRGVVGRAARDATRERGRAVRAQRPAEAADAAHARARQAHRQRVGGRGAVLPTLQDHAAPAHQHGEGRAEHDDAHVGDRLPRRRHPHEQRRHRLGQRRGPGARSRSRRPPSMASTRRSTSSTVPPGSSTRSSTAQHRRAPVGQFLKDYRPTTIGSRRRLLLPPSALAGGEQALHVADRVQPPERRVARHEASYRPSAPGSDRCATVRRHRHRGRRGCRPPCRSGPRRRTSPRSAPACRARPGSGRSGCDPPRRTAGSRPEGRRSSAPRCPGTSSSRSPGSAGGRRHGRRRRASG